MNELELKVMKKVSEWTGKLPVAAKLRVLQYLLESAHEERMNAAEASVVEAARASLGAPRMVSTEA